MLGGTSGRLHHDRGTGRTDDVGHTDENARLRVDGRVDDLVNTGGLKVAPRLVEEAILEHVPGVQDVLVVGCPDPEWGEAVCALVVLEPRAVRRGVTAADLREIGAAASQVSVRCERYSEAAQKMINR